MFGINKNGTKHKIGIIMPAYYPASRITRESVSVTADGVKTYSQLFNELYALIDFSKVTRNICVVTTWGTTEYKFEAETIDASNLFFTKNRTTNGNTYIETYSIANNSSSFISTTITNSGATSSDKSTTVVPSGYGIKFTLYY